MQKTANAKRALAGLKAKRVGDLNEDIISASCNAYRMEGIADIMKTPEPMRPIKSLGAGRYMAVFEKKAQADYKGVLIGGRCIAFEAKHTSADRIQESAVTDEQGDMLDRYSAMGGECFVLVSFDDWSFYKVPWYAWRNMKNIFRHQHIKQSEMPEQWRVRFDGNRLYFLTEDRDGE